MTGQELEVVDGEIVEQHGSLNLFGVSEPEQVIEKASSVATALAAVVKRQGLVTTIQSRDHVRVEGWTLLGSMLGVFPVCVWSKPLTKDGKPHGWEARVEARTRDGSVIGAAEAQCTREENQWSWQPTGRNGKLLEARDDYALRSMAQTRATSKAMRQPLGFVMQLAGFDPTPAEEMPRDDGPFTLPFGKHKGVPLEDVPREYLEWVVRESNNERARAEVSAFLSEQVEPQDAEPEIPF